MVTCYIPRYVAPVWPNMLNTHAYVRFWCYCYVKIQCWQLLPGKLFRAIPCPHSSHWSSAMVVWWSDGDVVSPGRHVIPVRLTDLQYRHYELGVQRGFRRPPQRFRRGALGRVRRKRYVNMHRIVSIQYNTIMEFIERYLRSVQER